jgi:hypothetical protein
MTVANSASTRLEKKTMKNHCKYFDCLSNNSGALSAKPAITHELAVPTSKYDPNKALRTSGTNQAEQMVVPKNNPYHSNGVTRGTTTVKDRLACTAKQKSITKLAVTSSNDF